MARNTSMPFSRRNRLVASAERGENGRNVRIVTEKSMIKMSNCKTHPKSAELKLTQNAVILEHLGDVHAHFLHIQLQRQAVHVQEVFAGLFLGGDLPFDVGHNAVENAVKVARAAGRDDEQHAGTGVFSTDGEPRNGNACLEWPIILAQSNAK